MLNDSQKAFAKKASEIRDFEKSISFATEEVGEFLQAQSKLRRGRPEGKDMTEEEVGDAILTLSIVAYHLDIEKISKSIDSKIERMKKILNITEA